MTDQLFNDNTNPQATPETVTTPPSVNPNDLFSDQLAAIKNDDGAPKYDTVEKAIEALQHSQQYIPELKSQMTAQEQVINELKEKLEANQTVQDIVAKQTPQPTDTPTSNSLGTEDITKLIADVLSERSVADTQTSNQASVNKALSERFGANAQAEVAKRATELGMKPSEIGELSKRNPAAVLALFGEKVGNISTTTNSFHIPADTSQPEALKAPVKSVLSGATAAEQTEFFKKVKAEIYQKYNINQ